MPKRKRLSGLACLFKDLLNSILDFIRLNPLDFIRLNPLDFIRLPKRKRLSSGWECLPDDLLNSILDRLHPLDYIRLSGVCKSWNLIALTHHKENGIRVSDHKPPWLLESSCHGKQKLFYYVTRAQIMCKLNIPYPYTRMLSCGCCHGRLIFFMSSELVVLDPFSGVVIRLPPFNNEFFNYVDKVILSTDPYLGSKFEVLATCRFSDVVAHLVFGEPMWTYSGRTRNYYTYNFVFYKDRILGASKEGRIVSLNIINSSSKDSSSPKRIIIEEISTEILQWVRFNVDTFFVETTNGELLMVTRSRAPKYNIFKIINSNGQLDLCPVVDLGGHSLFLGKHNSISVMASNYPGFCRPNTIYYFGSQNFRHSGVFEVFNFDDPSLRAYQTAFAMSEGSWIVPSLKLS